MLQKPDEKMGTRYDEAYVKTIQDDIRLAVSILSSPHNVHCPAHLFSCQNVEPNVTFDMACLQIDL